MAKEIQKSSFLGVSGIRNTQMQNVRSGCAQEHLTQRRGESVYNSQSPQALPVRPSWKNMPMMAIMARRPFAISAASLRCLTVASVLYRPIGLQPSSPGFLLGSELYPKGPDSQ